MEKDRGLLVVHSTHMQRDCGDSTHVCRETAMWHC